MLLRLITLVSAQALDLLTFDLMVGRHGVAAEANPIVASMFVNLGLSALVLGKVALVVAIGALVVAGAVILRRSVLDGRTPDRARTWAAVRGVPLALAIAAGLIGGITNTANILR